MLSLLCCPHGCCSWFTHKHLQLRSLENESENLLYYASHPNDSCSDYKTNIIMGNGSKISHILSFFPVPVNSIKLRLKFCFILNTYELFFFLFHEQCSLRTIYIVGGMMNNLGRRMCLDYRQAFPISVWNLSTHQAGSPWVSFGSPGICRANQVPIEILIREKMVHFILFFVLDFY